MIVLVVLGEQEESHSSLDQITVVESGPTYNLYEPP